VDGFWVQRRWGVGEGREGCEALGWGVTVGGIEGAKWRRWGGMCMG
jgi:hypothetical protein